MNSDLISRSELIKLVPPEEIVARMAIMKAPTVDLDERENDAFETGYIKGLCENRLTGEWEKDEDGYYRCSKCKIIYKKMPLDKNDKPRLVACAWCGTMMKGVTT